jgi:hypothetical protein
MESVTSDSLRTYLDRAASLMSMRLKGKPNIDPNCWYALPS